ncbi:MAG TPA: type II toxin-antitoxin system VapC family toxin [Nannocystaceae bacterium]|nr:type II toxin-antitoxin system VapC family toxin [Nannocystaceae bacterium]
MSLLLDTHAFLWFAAGDDHLSDTARKAVEDESGSVSLSVGSIWEIAIKSSIGKLVLAVPLGDAVRKGLDACGAELQPITIGQLERVATLPFPSNGHRDPFDRLLAATALELGYAIVSKDPSFDAYGVARVW